MFRTPGRIAAVILAACLTPGIVAAQVDPPPPPTQDSVTVVPGAIYEASDFYRALVGSGYRDLWTTAIRVPVADMGTLGGGGLTPIELGGGTTTQTLHLRGADGHRYVFRSVHKTPTELLEDLEGTPAEAIIQDQMSSFHPSGAPVVARLLEAVSVLHPEPELMVVPDDPRLGEFREQFAGMHVLFEERPDDLPEGAPGFAGSTRIVQTDDLFDELEESSDNRIALEELLRTRLIDLLAGDRDRSVNNHLWARFGAEGDYLWRPIPRDRDQAFVQFDGFLKAIGRAYEFRLVPFREEYANTHAVTRNAWDIDRNLLVGVDRETWESTVSEVVRSISDEVIRDAVSRMPPEHYALMGPELEAKLRLRRDALPTVAEEFYGIVFRFADVHGTDEDEMAEVQGLEGGSVLVRLRRRSDSGEPDPLPHFERVFSPDETREVRLYLHGGDDVALARGAPSSITVRVVGGGGADELTNAGAGSVIFYDGGNQTLAFGDRVRRVDDSPSRPWSWFEESYDVDWGSATIPRPGLSYDSDRGLVPIVGLEHVRYGFAKLPYAYDLSLQAGWAFTHAKPIVESFFTARHFFSDIDLDLEARFSGIEVVNFFGLGNETDNDAPDSFYEVDQEQLVLGANLTFGDETLSASFGPVLKRVVSDTTGAPNLLADVSPYGTGDFTQVGARFQLEWTQTDAVTAPSSGYRLTGGLAYYPRVADVEEAFGAVQAEAATYLSPSGGNPTIALRAGAKKLWGDLPYFESAFLGGAENLRGLQEERYAGDAAVYGSAELRAYLARLTLIVPFDFGLFAFTDTGRVYLDGEASGEWHSGAGGGIWLAPLDRRTTLRLSVGAAEGERAFYAGIGFAF